MALTPGFSLIRGVWTVSLARLKQTLSEQNIFTALQFSQLPLAESAVVLCKTEAPCVSSW